MELQHPGIAGDTGGQAADHAAVSPTRERQRHRTRLAGSATSGIDLNTGMSTATPTLRRP
jgi:hypothetical protein